MKHGIHLVLAAFILTVIPGRLCQADLTLFKKEAVIAAIKTTQPNQRYCSSPAEFVPETECKYKFTGKIVGLEISMEGVQKNIDCVAYIRTPDNKLVKGTVSNFVSGSPPGEERCALLRTGFSREDSAEITIYYYSVELGSTEPYQEIIDVGLFKGGKSAVKSLPMAW